MFYINYESIKNKIEDFIAKCSELSLEANATYRGNGLCVALFNDDGNKGYAKIRGVNIGLLGCSAADVDGVQLSPVSSSQNMNGVEVGVVNLACYLDGVQLGVVNGSRSPHGIQAGIANISLESCDGVQLGAYNTSDTVYGLQLGLVSKAKGGKYLQLGLLNIREKNPDEKRWYKRFGISPLIGWGNH